MHEINRLFPMASDSNKQPQFWQELKRRKVVRVITVYAATSFVLLELVDIIAEPLGLPDWTLPFLIVLLSVGFIISVILSWIYDITPEGIQKTLPAKKLKSEEKEAIAKGWKITIIFSILIFASIILFYVIGNINHSTKLSKLKKSIAVLPFENWSVGEENAHLGNAIANEIITELFKIQDFHVISYTSSSQYTASSKLSIPEIGKQLGANFIIEGTIERQNDDVNIHVQVIQAANDDHIWANEFSGKWKDIFKIQDDIALSVADKLKAVLTPEEIKNIDAKPTVDPEAYDYYLRGKSLYEQNMNSLNDEAIYWFKKSIVLDSSFALPWTHLSMLYWRKAITANTPEFREAKLANKKALELNPSSGVAIVNMAEILDNEYKFEEAKKKIDQALEIEPEHPYVLRNAGRFYTLLSRHDESISFCTRALEDDPTNSTALQYLIRAYFYAGHFEETWRKLLIKEKLGLRNDSYLYYQLLLEEGKLDRVLNEPIYQNDEASHTFGLAAAYFKSGKRLIAKQYCDSLKESNIKDCNYIIALAQAYGDETEEVALWLERSFEAKEKRLVYMGVEPAFKRLRNEPRIKNILQKMNYPK